MLYSDILFLTVVQKMNSDINIYQVMPEDDEFKVKRELHPNLPDVYKIQWNLMKYHFLLLLVENLFHAADMQKSIDSTMVF